MTPWGYRVSYPPSGSEDTVNDLIGYRVGLELPHRAAGSDAIINIHFLSPVG
jgi:hypothetical protein